MQEDIEFLKAQNEFLKEQLAKQQNLIFMLKQQIKKTINDGKSI